MAQLAISIGVSLASSLIMRALQPDTEGPRLKDLRFQTSVYHGMIPLLYGRIRVAPNIIDTSDMRENAHQSGGKGGPTHTDYTYSADMACMISANPIAGVAKIWKNNRLTWSEDSNDPFPGALYLGTATQMPDPTLEALHGVGNVPAYRHRSYCVFPNEDTTETGNARPIYNFEVYTTEPPTGELRAVKLRTFENDWGGYDAIKQWPLTGGVIRAGLRTTVGGAQDSMLPSAIATFDADTLEYLGPTVPDGGDAWVQNIQAFLDGSGSVEIRYSARTTYIGEDDAVHNIWNWDIPQSSNPIFATDDLNTTVDPPTGAEVLDTLWGAIDWGNEDLVAMVTSQNSRRLFLFTNDAQAFGYADKWYELINGEITRQGTVDPPLNTGALGNDRVATLASASSFENQGRYMWTHVSNGNFEGHSGGTVYLYEIDEANNFALAVDPIAADTLNQGAIEITLGNQRSSGFVIKTGYFGIVVGNALAVFTRLRDAGGITLGEIIADVSERCALTPEEIDVSKQTQIVPGYAINQQRQARTSLEELMRAYQVGAVDSDGVVKFVNEGGLPTFEIDGEYLAAHNAGEDLPPAIETTFADVRDLPSFSDVGYIAAEADYLQGNQSDRRQATTSQQRVTLDLQIALTDARGRGIAGVELYRPWVERETYRSTTLRRYARIEPTDVGTIGGRTVKIIDRNDEPGGVIRLTYTKRLRPDMYKGGTAAAASGFTPQTTSSKPPTAMLLLDLPLLVESQYQYGFQWAKRPNDTGAWAGASLQRSVDGSTYSEVASSTVRDVIGTASGALPDFPGGNTFDESSVLTVALNSGELSSVTSDVLLGDRTANLYCVGRELLQVRDWELIATNTWEGTGMLRGRFGTETAMAVHETGERFAQVPVTDVDAPFADLNRTRYYKPVTFSTSLDDVLPETFVNTGLRLKPLSPVQLGGGSDGDGNATLQWVPRSRIGGGFGAIPLGEAAERYVVEIRDYSQTQVARIKIVDDAQEVEYPASEQVEDFGDEQQNIYFSVALVGSIGLGQRAFGSVPGVGDSDDAPLAPIAPYGTGPLNPPPSGAVNGELVWSPTGPHYTQGYLVGQTYVVEFTAGATTTATVSCAQHGDPPFFRRLRICTDSSGVDLLPNGENIGTTASATVNVSNGVTYYAVITCEESPGVPSGPLGADADMIIELSHP